MSQLNITLDKSTPTSRTERVRIRHGENGTDLWMSITSTSAKCVYVSFHEPDGKEYNIVKESLIK